MIVIKYHGQGMHLAFRNAHSCRCFIFFWNASLFFGLRNRALETQKGWWLTGTAHSANLGCRKKGPVFKPLAQWYAGETPACPLCQWDWFSGLPTTCQVGSAGLCFRRINKRFRTNCPNIHYEISRRSLRMSFLLWSGDVDRQLAKVTRAFCAVVHQDLMSDNWKISLLWCRSR